MREVNLVPRNWRHSFGRWDSFQDSLRNIGREGSALAATILRHGTVFADRVRMHCARAIEQVGSVSESLRNLIEQETFSIGMQVAPDAIRIAAIKRIGSEVCVTFLREWELRPGVVEDFKVTDEASFATALYALRRWLSVADVPETARVALAVDGHSVIVKRLLMPAMTEQEIAEQIRWEAEQHIPFDINHVLVSWDRNDADDLLLPGQMAVNLVAAKADYVGNYAALLRTVRFPLAAAEPHAWSIQRLVRHGLTAHVPKESLVAFVDVGTHTSTIVFLNDANIVATRTVRAGSSRDMDRMVAEVRKFVDFQLAVNPKSLFAGFFVSGPGNGPALREALNAAFPDAFIDALVPRIVSTGMSPETLSRFAIPIGLALRTNWSPVMPNGIRYADPVTVAEGSALVH